MHSRDNLLYLANSAIASATEDFRNVVCEDCLAIFPSCRDAPFSLSALLALSDKQSFAIAKQTKPNAS